uniref:Uncharacterized protein n=1 Tax=Myripristis murdjan TaxID=586833 RepID=A0A667YX69_9TELE
DRLRTRWSDYTSGLAWECLGISQMELVGRQKGIIQMAKVRQFP